MKRFILTSAVVAFAAVFAFTTNVEAAPHGGGHAAIHSHFEPHAHAAVLHGHPIHGAVHGAGYRGWASRCWFGNYRTYGYYSGADGLWYYWYAPFNEYLPVSYMSVYVPTPVAVPVATVMPVAMPTAVAVPSGATLIPGPISAP